MTWTVSNSKSLPPHPAGLPGTHIHFVDPVSREKTVWYINYQDVVALGHLLKTGTLTSTA